MHNDSDMIPLTAEAIEQIQEELSKISPDQAAEFSEHAATAKSTYNSMDAFDPALLKVSGNRGKGRRGKVWLEVALKNLTVALGIASFTTWQRDKVRDVLNDLVDDRPSREDREEEKQYVRNLSGAVFCVVQKYGYANVRVVGAAALNRAVKAIIISQSDLLKHGVKVATEFSFQDVDINGQIKTGYLLHVRV